MKREKAFKILGEYYSELIVENDIKEILEAIDNASNKNELVRNIVALRNLDTPMLPPFPGKSKAFKYTQLYATFISSFLNAWEASRIVENEIQLQIKELQARFPNDVRVVETDSDVVATKVGNDDFAYEIGNGIGDGVTVNVIIDKIRAFDERDSINDDFFDMQGCLVARNNTYIYDYDCGNTKTNVMLKGRYIIYSGSGYVIFQKLSDE